MKNKGFVQLVGAGPGDELLITRKGFQALKDCQVLIYDSLSSDAFLQYVPSDCEKLYVGKRCGHHSMKQEEINALLVEKGLEGKRVVRLKGGDPFVFGRGGEEVIALQENQIPFEVIPGVTSAIAAPAYAGIPVTHRGVSRSFHVITGHTASLDNPLGDNFETYAKLEGTLIFLMGLNHLALIAEGLVSNGKSKDTPVALIENGTLPSQRNIVGTLANIVELATEKNVVSPAIIVVGGAAALTFKDQSDSRPLFNRKIAVTGTPSMVKKLSRRLEQEGASVYPCDYLEVVSEGALLDDCLENIEKYRWIMFTSSNSIRIFFDRMKQLRIDRRILSQLKFAVVGTGTGKELEQYGIYPDFMPACYTTKALAEEFSKTAAKDERILIPRAKKGSKELTEILDREHIPYDDIALYDVVPDTDKLDALSKAISACEYVTFESSSGVDGFFELKDAKEMIKNVTPVCIGNVTADTLKKRGVDKMLIGDDNTIEGIISSLINRKEERYV